MAEENTQNESDMKIVPLIAAQFSGDLFISYVNGRVVVERILPAPRLKPDSAGQGTGK